MLTLFNKDIDLHLRAILNLNPFVNKGPEWLLDVKHLGGFFLLIAKGNLLHFLSAARDLL